MSKKIEIRNYPKVSLNFSPKIPDLKKIEDKAKINVRYALISPFAFAHIYWDSRIYELAYNVEEPYLNKIEEGYKNEIMSDRKSTRLNSSHTDISRMPSSA